MLIPKDRFKACYEGIRDAARDAGGGCSVLLLVAADVDAICAARILATFLRADGIEYVMSPVSGYGDVRKCMQESGSNLRTVVMLNCGGGVPLKQLLEVPPGVVLYVLDSHLPYHHTNVNDREMIVVLDYSGNDEGVPKDGDDEITREYTAAELEAASDGESDEEEEEGEGEEGEEDDDAGQISGGSEAEPLDGEEEDGDGAKGGSRTNTPGRKRGGGAAGASSSSPSSSSAALIAAGGGSSSSDAPLIPSATSPGGRSQRSAQSVGAEQQPQEADVSRKRKRLKRQDDDEDAEEEEGADFAAAQEDSHDDDDDDDDDDKGDGSGSDSDDSDAATRKRRRARQRAAEKAAARAAKERTRQIVEQYNRYYAEGSRYGLPVSFLVHDLAAQLNRCRNDIVWLVCVGCTAPFLAEHISRGLYDEVFAILRRTVLDRNKEVDKPVDDETKDVVHAGRDGHIALVEEPRFVVHRQWCLYDAMRYSEYVASRLCIDIDDRGTMMLDKLLAKTGVPVKTCKQSFVHMLAHERREFMSRLRILLDDDDIWRMKADELFYPSFERTMEREAPRSAADVVHSLNGLLAAGNVNPAMLEAVLGVPGGGDGAGSSSSSSSSSAGGAPPNSGSPGTGGRAGGGSSASALGSVTELTSWSSTTWRDNFAKAFASLSKKGGGSDLFEMGVEYAKMMRYAIARVTPAIIRVGAVHNDKMLRWIEVDEDVTDSERRLFAQPLALSELGRMLVRVHRDSLMVWRGKRGKVENKPLLMTLRHVLGGDGGSSSGAAAAAGGGDGKAEYVTVMGLPVATREGGETASNFLDAFRAAAEESRARYLIDSFDSSSMLIDRRDLKSFLVALSVDPDA